MIKYKLITIFLMFSAFLFSCSTVEDVAKKNTAFNNSIVQRTTEGSMLINNYRGEVDSNSKVVKYLTLKGRCSQSELYLMNRMEQEVYPSQIKTIIFNGGHYYYDGFDNGQTGQNCGVYAAKRLLRHLGQQDIVDKDLWYKYSDVELRDMIASIAGEEYRSQNQPLYETTVKQLLNQLGCPPEYVRIERRGAFWENSVRNLIRDEQIWIRFLNDIEVNSQDIMIQRINSGYYDGFNFIDDKRGTITRLYFDYKDSSGDRNRLKDRHQEELTRLQQRLDNGNYNGV